MPPLPNTFDKDTSDLIDAAQRHQTDLAEFQIPRLRSCQGPLSLQQDLAAELREDVDTFARQIEALDVLVDDQKSAKNRRELKGIVDDLNESLASLRREARAALLASKRTIDSLSKSHREELLRSSAVSEKRDSNEKVTDDALMAASDNVTAALQRTIGLMQGELERSVLSTQMLDSSTATLRAASSTHDTLTGVMDTSKQLITALEKSDWLDRVLILSGLFFFLLVVLFILKQRIFDRGMRIAFWWTRFVPDFSGDEQLLSMEKGAAATLSSVVNSASVVTSGVVSITSSAASVASAILAGSASTSILDPEPTPDSEPESSLDVDSSETLHAPIQVDTAHVEL